MPLPYGTSEVDAVVFGLEDGLVPLRTAAAWQWAWRPQGPVLGERRVHAAIRRALREWDRRRWRGLTGKDPPADLAALRAHLAAALAEIAGRPLPEPEVEAVVRRLLHPAGEVERFPDAAPALRRLASAGVRTAIATGLPDESARWLLQRAGLDASGLIRTGEALPLLPERAAFRALAEAIDVPLAHTAFVGPLFWSDVRAAARAGMAAVLLDRFDVWPKVRSGRVGSLEALERSLASGGHGVEPAEAAVEPGD